MLFVGIANHSSHFSQKQKSSSKYEMESKIAQQQEAMQQQQIQALLANVEKLTHQNEELRKTMESQNIERQRTGKNQKEEESNS